MKLLLINPPTSNDKKFIREGRCTQEQGVWATLWPPLSLATMGAVLEEAGHVVQIVDCAAQEMSRSELEHVIRDVMPGAVITGRPGFYA